MTNTTKLSMVPNELEALPPIGAEGRRRARGVGGASGQLDEFTEAQQQVGFADRILLSKSDLVSESEIKTLSERIRRMNPRAPVKKVHFGEMPIEEVLDIRGFNLNAVLEIDPTFLEDLSRLSRLFARFRPPNAEVDWIVAVPQLPVILSGLGLDQYLPPPELPQLVVDWLAEHPGPEQALPAERLLLRWLEHQGPTL